MVAGTGVFDAVVLQPDLIVADLVVEQDGMKLSGVRRIRCVVAVPPVDPFRLLSKAGAARMVP